MRAFDFVSYRLVLPLSTVAAVRRHQPRRPRSAEPLS
ncbi:hypothetical protein SUDANB140_05917 [Streptomyces sp. enrichment culture]